MVVFDLLAFSQEFVYLLLFVCLFVYTMTERLLKECPLLVALDKEKTVYDGFISVQVSMCMYVCIYSRACVLVCTTAFFFIIQERDLRLRITLPPDHQLKQAKYKNKINFIYVIYL